MLLRLIEPVGVYSATDATLLDEWRELYHKQGDGTPRFLFGKITKLCAFDNNISHIFH